MPLREIRYTDLAQARKFVRLALKHPYDIMTVRTVHNYSLLACAAFQECAHVVCALRERPLSE